MTTSGASAASALSRSATAVGTASVACVAPVGGHSVATRRDAVRRRQFGVAEQGEQQVGGDRRWLRPEPG